MEATIAHFIEMLEEDVISQEDFDELLAFFITRPGITQRPKLQPGHHFDLDNYNNIVVHFKFRRRHIYELQRLFGINDELEIPASSAHDLNTDGAPVEHYRIPGTTALCVLLRRLAYHRNLDDLEQEFGMTASMLSAIVNFMTSWIVNAKGYLLTDITALRWLTPERLEAYAKAVASRGAALKMCVGFVAGTTRQICRPTKNHRQYYNVHKKHHCVKYQSIVTPDGMIVNMPGPYEGKRHDTTIWRKSGTYDKLRPLLRSPTTHYVIYGDISYPLTDILITPYTARSKNPYAPAFNESMFKVRHFAELGFDKIMRYFPFLDFRRNQNLLLGDVGDLYKAATILNNCHTALYGSRMGDHFDVDPPSLKEYLTQERA